MPHAGGVLSAATQVSRDVLPRLRPISPDFVPGAVAVSGLDRATFEREGADPEAGMPEAREWVQRQAEGAQPVLVGHPLELACDD